MGERYIITGGRGTTFIPLETSLSEWEASGFTVPQAHAASEHYSSLHLEGSYNPIADHVLPAGIPDNTATLICWSGTLADELFARDPRNWGPVGFEALHAAMRGLEFAALRGEFRVLFRTHARHVLNDPTRCQAFLAELGGRPFGIAFDPASMFEESMLRDAEDHLQRMFESLGPRCGCVILGNVQPPQGALNEDEAPMKSMPLWNGVLPARTLLKLTQALVPANIPVLIVGEDQPADGSEGSATLPA